MAEPSGIYHIEPGACIEHRFRTEAPVVNPGESAPIELELPHPRPAPTTRTKINPGR